MLHPDQRGSVLWLVLLLINAIALLMVMSTEMIELESKLSAHYFELIEHQTISFSVVQTIYQKFSHHEVVDCLDLPSVVIVPIKADAVWWHTAVGICRDFFQGQGVQYLFEQWEESPCETLDGQHTVQFWRATVRIEEPSDLMPPYFVQAVFANSTENLLSACSGSVRLLSAPFQTIYFPRA